MVKKRKNTLENKRKLLFNLGEEATAKQFVLSVNLSQNRSYNLHPLKHQFNDLADYQKL